MKTKKRITLITGAGRGIGASLALELGKDDNHVILAGRSLNDLISVKNEIKTAGGTASILEIDITNYTIVDKLENMILEKWGGLDTLIINAGILGFIGPLKDQKPDNFFNVINVNLISAHRLIRSLDCILRQSHAGKALIIGSGSAVSKKPFMGAYAISKAGLEHMAYLWASETINTNLRINIIDPGATRTKMRSDAIPNENPLTIPSPNEIAKKILPFTKISYNGHGQRIRIRDL